MSVVAARVHVGGGFTMAADSILVRWRTQTVGTSKFAKLWEEGQIVIGTSGTAEEGGLMRLFSMNHQPAANSIRALTEYLGEFAAWKDKRAGSGALGNAYLIGWSGSLYRSQGYFVDEVRTYEAIGAGEDYALAALHLGHSPKVACETAIALSTLCEGPVLEIERRAARDPL